MFDGRIPRVVVDGRIIFRPQCRGIAQSVIGPGERSRRPRPTAAWPTAA
ncbi:MAG: hypothetical protein ACYCUG_14465 [Acidimicrobiales bacterium]